MMTWHSVCLIPHVFTGFAGKREKESLRVQVRELAGTSTGLSPGDPCRPRRSCPGVTSLADPVVGLCPESHRSPHMHEPEWRWRLLFTGERDPDVSYHISSIIAYRPEPCQASTSPPLAELFEVAIRGGGLDLFQNGAWRNPGLLLARDDKKNQDPGLLCQIATMNSAITITSGKRPAEVGWGVSCASICMACPALTVNVDE